MRTSSVAVSMSAAMASKAIGPFRSSWTWFPADTSADAMRHRPRA
jgi:hypothetical protein